MMFCRKCGNEIADDSNFCTKCGVRQDERPSGLSQLQTVDSQKENRPNQYGAAGSGRSRYFDHSTKAITNMVFMLISILAILLVVTLFINGVIENLDSRPYFHNGDRIELLETIRNWNILFDVSMAGGVLFRCFLTNKNYLRINDTTIDGVGCPSFGFSTITIRDYNISDITSVKTKNANMLIITADKEYVFLIEDAKKAAKIIRRKMNKE